MECERLNRLVRSWYIQVQDEALAPGRMVEFMETHLMDCDVCLTDPDVQHEVKKITEIVLPASKKQPKPAETEKVFPPPPETVESDNEREDVDGDEPVVPDVDDKT
jgi:hypothetical protein